jgi:DNA recombination protein RmuC
MDVSYDLVVKELFLRFRRNPAREDPSPTPDRTEGFVSTSIVALAVFVLGAAVGGVAVGLALARSLRSLRAEAASSREALARTESDLENERRAAADQRTQSEKLENRFRDAFSALSAEALRQNNQSFLDLAKTVLGEFQKGAEGGLEAREKAIGELVTPVRAALEKVDARLQDVEKQRVGAYAALQEQVKSLGLTQQQLQSETANLVKALRAPQVRGRWGEIQLRRVVEMAGMLEQCDFLEQESVTTEGGRLRPDLLVRLPGGKTVVVDAKAPLAAYLEAVEAPDDATRGARLKDHARQVREHMTRLGAKAYWDQFRPAPEFVVMFLPGETFFSAALEQDPSLIEYGVDRFVIPASPTTLIALLRSVYYGWQQERIAESAEAIRDLGADLYDRLVKMTEHLGGLRSHLDQAVKAFNASIGSFETRVLVPARKLKEMGAATSKELIDVPPIERSPRAIDAAGSSSEEADPADPDGDGTA